MVCVFVCLCVLCACVPGAGRTPRWTVWTALAPGRWQDNGGCSAPCDAARCNEHRSNVALLQGVGLAEQQPPRADQGSARVSAHTSEREAPGGAARPPRGIRASQRSVTVMYHSTGLSAGSRPAALPAAQALLRPRRAPGARCQPRRRRRRQKSTGQGSRSDPASPTSDHIRSA